MINNYFNSLYSDSSELNDLLFSKRNRTYGAYQLRKSYSRNMSIGLAISIFFFVIAFLIPSIHWNADHLEYTMTEVFDSAVPVMESPKVQLKTGKPDIPATNKLLKEPKAIDKDELPKIVNDEQQEPSQSTQSEIIDSTIKKASDSKPEKDSLKGNGAIEGDGDQTFDIVDVMPQFPGGQKSLSRFISSRLKYPGVALQNKIEGVVIVGFIIDKNGQMRNPKILRSLYPACDEEALRVVRLIPDWTPAKNQGRNVSIHFSIPIEFKLIH